MAHATVRAAILPDIISLIAQNYGWTEKEALDQFYTSRTGACFAEDETGLYGQSPLYIFQLFREEESPEEPEPLPPEDSKISETVTPEEPESDGNQADPDTREKPSPEEPEPLSSEKSEEREDSFDGE